MLLQTRMNRTFDDLLRGFPKFSAELVPLSAAQSPRMDVRENAAEILVEAELPGVEEQDIELTLHEGTLVLRGEKKLEQKLEQEGWHLTERAYGSFQRVIGLPAEIDAAKIEATFEKGVLRVRLPKLAAAEAVAKRIAIKSGR
ncbi:MAG: Hsp20/alpha crystallin family protein [Planctomycetes bacterium]|nr:Hsp20/alpha crystallin family protein [Planctomycetota bacterium]